MLTPWTTLATLDRLFDDVMRDVTGTALRPAATPVPSSPAVDVRSNDDEVVFVFDVPGVRREDLEITLEGDRLRVRGERKYDGSDKDKVWLGRSYGPFQQSFTLPEGLDADNLSAHLADGVLTLRLPRHPRSRPRRIEINGGSEPRQLGGGDRSS